MNQDKNRRLIIIGASGHGKVVADIAELCGYSDIVFFDDDSTVKECAGYSVNTIPADLPEGDVFVAIGNPEVRKAFMDKYSERFFPVLIHPSAVVARSAGIGAGTAVMAGAVINSDSVIGNGCIINTCASVDHDCVIGDYVHIAVGAHLSGTVNVGHQTWVGAGAIVSNNIDICGSCVIGAGAVVTEDITKPGTYVGIPAAKLR